MRTTDLVGGPFTPPGFYYKTFIRPRRFWPLYEKFLRHAAGLGKLKKSAARARVAHRVPPPSRRRPRDRGWGRRPERGGGGGGARCRRGARRRGPRAGRAAARRGRGAVRARARRAGARERRRDPRERARARHVRRPRAGLAGRHAPPGPRAAHGVRHRRDRAAAALPRERPAGRDAVGRRPPARRHVRGAAGDARGGGDRRRPRAARGARAARRWRGDLLRRRPSRPRAAAARPPRSSATNVDADARLDRARGARPQPRVERRDREARLGRGRPDRVRPARGVGRERAGHLARRAGRREDGVRRVARPLRARRGAGRYARRRRDQGQGGPRVRLALGNDRGRGGGPRARLRRRGLPRPARRRARASSSGRLAGACRRAAARDEQPQGQVLRLPVRGRDREGHPPVGRGGLRLDRALEALHDRDDGPVPGPDVPAARRAADGEGDRHEPVRRGHHDAAPAVARGADGRARRAARSSRRSAARSTRATASSARTCCGRATGAAPTTTATRRPRRWRCTGRRG